MWHVHRFREVERVYAPGKPLRRVAGEGSLSGNQIVSRIIFGVTTIVSRCDVCGKLDTVEIFGDARKISN